MKRFEFGFLSEKISLQIERITIEPQSSIDDTLKKIHQSPQYHNGHLYPPVVQRRIGTQLFHVPPSHSIASHSTPFNKESFYRGEGGLVIHLLGMLFQTRLQFSDWEFDGRTCVDVHPIGVIGRKSIESNMHKIFETWSAWSKQSRDLYISALYLHNRCISYFWEWEKFWWRCAVLDACWRVAESEGMVSERKRSRTLRTMRMIRAFRMAGANLRIQKTKKNGLLLRRPVKPRGKRRRIYDYITTITKLRNELVHEGTWDGVMPGLTIKSAQKPSAYDCNLRLTWLLQRMLLAVGGVRSRFVRSDWTDRNPNLLDSPE